jgi:hypothetical protein
VPREVLVKSGAAGRPLGRAAVPQVLPSARPMTLRAGLVGPLQARARVTGPGTQPATGRAGPPGHPRAPVSAARPGRLRADREGQHAGLLRSTENSGARGPTAANDAMTRPPRATEHAVPTVRTDPRAVTAAAVRTVRTDPQAVTAAAVPTVPRGRARAVRRVSGLRAAAVRVPAVRARLVASGPILLAGQPAAEVRTAHLRGQPTAVPGRDLRHARWLIRVGTAHPGRPVTVTAVGRRSGQTAGGHGKEEVPGFLRPAVRPAAISRGRMPRASLIPSVPTNLILRHGLS